MAPSLLDSEAISRAETELKKLDPLLGVLIARQTLPPYNRRNDYFASLSRSIIGQQVSVAAAAAIYERYERLTKVQPAVVAGLDENTIKTIGLSRQKASYLRDLALHFVEDSEVYTHLETQSDEQVIAELTAVKGIGVWTAQMFLMFTLLRPDVFAPDDVGLQKSMAKLYGWERVPSRAMLVEAAEAWRPYRTVASWHLWRSLDNTPD